MANLTDALHGMLSPEVLTQLDRLVTHSEVSAAPPTTVTTGAIPVTTQSTFITIADTVGYTLADGLYSGQKKYIRCTAVSGSPAGTVTPATPVGFSSLAFNAAEDLAVLEWHGTDVGTAGWRVAAVSSVTVNA